MKRKIIAATVIAILLLAGVVVRLALLAAHSYGDGGAVSSPDGRYEAELFVMTSRGFLGGLRRYYHIEVIEELDSGDQMILYQRNLDMPKGLAEIDVNHLQGVIRWSTDSQSVVYTVGELTIDVDIGE